MASLSKPSSSSRGRSQQLDHAYTVDILASCYLVDGSGGLRALHYSTTGATGIPSPPSSPPLAALTSSRELVVLPKSPAAGADAHHGAGMSGARDAPASSSDDVKVLARRRGGLTAPYIKEECERFFCGPMAAAFLAERIPRANGPISMYGAHNYHDLSSNSSSSLPASPFSDPLSIPTSFASARVGAPLSPALSSMETSSASFAVAAWMEIWDYVGGASFRAFVAEDDTAAERSLFVFLDAALSRDLKQAFVALIELAEGPLECNHVVLCIDRRMCFTDAQALLRSVQWIGFSPITLDYWARAVDVVSNRWLFASMEL